MIDIKITRPIIIVGKPGTNKTVKALNLLGDDPIVQYADEYDIEDNFSIPVDKGIIIQEAHYKPNTEKIVATLLQYKGQVVLTSDNQKDVPKKIYNLCKLKRAGSSNNSLISSRYGTANASDPINYEINIFEMLHDYVKNSDREEVLFKLKMNKPYDEQILAWLASNIHPNKIAYLDSKVKRKWSQDYFYELLAYAHHGKNQRVEIPSRRTYSKIPAICRRVGLKSNEEYLLEQLLEDEDFAEYVKKKVNNVERRTLKLSEKKRKKIPPKQKGLGAW
ncbi:uncharacterized protein METZ01_LOCUS285744 [marine metagenome]|uniref:Uncharacterized protein n=1 Tax=marine metagenome TaxID=408172 RepID=A0A382L888_9ZZZZ